MLEAAKAGVKFKSVSETLFHEAMKVDKFFHSVIQGYEKQEGEGVEAARRCVDTLIELGANLEGRDEAFHPPLLRATCTTSPDPDWIRALLEAGADVDAGDEQGLTAMEWAQLHVHSPSKSGISQEVASLFVRAQLDSVARDAMAQRSAVSSAAELGSSAPRRNRL